MATNKPKIIYFAGDSTTEGSGTSTLCFELALIKRLGQGWAGQLMAAGGTNSTEMITRWQTVRTAAGTTKYTSPAARYLVVMGMVNDLYQSVQWAATTAYTTTGGSNSTPKLVHPTNGKKNGHIYRCTTGGTSGGSEPTWTTTEAGTVSDGTVVWTEHNTRLKKIVDDAVADNANTPGYWTKIYYCPMLGSSSYSSYGGAIFGNDGGVHAQLIIDTMRTSVLAYSDPSVTTVDTYALLNGAPGGTGLSASASGSVTVNGFTYSQADFYHSQGPSATDGLHENNDGHDRIAEHLANLIRAGL